MQKSKSFYLIAKSNSNQSGQIAPLLALFLTLFFAVIIHFIYSNFRNHESMNQQMKALLCFKKSYKSSSSLLKSMANYNKVIAASFISKNTPGPWVQAATATYEATKKAQQLHYSFSLMKFLSLKSTCSYLNIARLVKSFPYKGKMPGFLLIRNFNGTAKITRKKWEIRKHILPINGKNPEIIKLNATFHIKNNYTSPKTKIVWKEVSLPSKLPLPLRSY